MKNILTNYWYLSVIFCLFLQSVVRKIESNPTAAGDKPKKDVVIAECGSLPVDEPFAVEKKASEE